jgi:hypothetical protein
LALQPGLATDGPLALKNCAEIENIQTPEPYAGVLGVSV